jgi:cobalt transporter subunit CbtA
MITRLLSAALLAGLVAGLVTSAIQHAVTVPVIQAAEVYEQSTTAPAPAAVTPTASPTTGHHDHAMTGMAGHDHEHDPNAWAPADGFERILFTTIATVAASVGFALVLLAGMIAANDQPTPRRALAWAAGGFAAFSLAPAMGLSPELPGMEAAPIVARQIWWAATVAATAGGLWLAIRGGKPIAMLGGIVLIALPHLFGAPTIASTGSSGVPAELASRFAASVLGVAAIMWALIGAGVGYAWQRLEKTAA